MSVKVLFIFLITSSLYAGELMEYCVYKDSFPIVLPNRTITGVAAVRALGRQTDGQPLFISRLSQTGNPKYVQLNIQKDENNLDILDALVSRGIILPLREINVSNDGLGNTITDIQVINEPPNNYYGVKEST